MSHPNARLTVPGRRLLVARVRAGRPVAHVADEMGISRTTAHKWIRGRRIAGDAGLYDHPRRPLTTPVLTRHKEPAALDGPAHRPGHPAVRGLPPPAPDNGCCSSRPTGLLGIATTDTCFGVLLGRLRGRGRPGT